VIGRGLGAAGVVFGAGFLAACGGGNGSSSSSSAAGGSTSGGGGGGAAGAAGAGVKVTEGQTLAPFKTNMPIGEVPSLPKSIAFTFPSQTPYYTAIENGLKEAGEARGLDYIGLNSQSDPAKQSDNIEQVLTRGVGAIMLNPVDSNSVRPALEKAMEAGVCVITQVTAPASDLQNVNQFDVGKIQAETAVAMIKERFGGKAQVLVMNQNLVESLVPRDEGVLSVMKKAPSGIEMVDDIGVKAQTPEASAEAMSAALQAHPDINVVLAADYMLTGVMSAVASAGKSGIVGVGTDGEPEQLEAIENGDPRYGGTVAFNIGGGGYSAGMYAADWLEGKSIPQGTGIVLQALTTPSAVKTFLAAGKNPAEAWNDPTYFKYFGNISYETHQGWVDYVWQPEE
jgi:ribose transport system substrate-binding protein